VGALVLAKKPEEREGGGVPLNFDLVSFAKENFKEKEIY